MIITLVGDNQHARHQAAQELVAAFEAQHGPLAIERFDAAEQGVEHILSAVEATSLFNPEKLVVIDHFDSNKMLTEQTEALLDKVSIGTTVLIIIDKLDKRLAYGKLLKKESDYREYNQLSSNDIVGWCVQTAEEKGGQLDRDTARYLVEYVGPDQDRLQNELEKLVLFDPAISRETIQTMCEPQPNSTIFDLLEAGFRGQHNRALQLYDDQRKQQVEPLAIMSMIAWQLHIISVVMFAGDRSGQTIAKDVGVHPFVVQKTTGLVKRLKLAQLRQLLDHALKLELAMKSRPIQADDALEHFLLSL